MATPSAAVARTACALALLGVAPIVCAAEPLLRSAEARIRVSSATSCEVDLTLAVSDAVRIEHRIESVPGSRVELVDLSGATAVGPIRTVGRTRALELSPSGPTYTVRYSVRQPASDAYRCPLWLPTVPADGQSRAVRLVVTIPEGAIPGGTMPVFEWVGTQGSSSLGHVPAFVRVPFAMPGTRAPWDLARIMDGVSVVTLVGATLAWARWRRRRSAPSSAAADRGRHR